MICVKYCECRDGVLIATICIKVIHYYSFFPEKKEQYQWQCSLQTPYGFFSPPKSLEQKDFTPTLLASPLNSMLMSISSLCWGHLHTSLQPSDFSCCGNTNSDDCLVPCYMCVYIHKLKWP